MVVSKQYDHTAAELVVRALFHVARWLANKTCLKEQVVIHARGEIKALVGSLFTFTSPTP